MSALDVGLVVALALLALVVAAQGRALSAAARRLDLLERRVDRRERRTEARTEEPAPAVATAPGPTAPAARPEPAAQPTAQPTAGPTAGPSAQPAAQPAAEPEGDAVDVRGADPEGEPTVVPLEATEQPTLLAFLSTSCGICVGLWERLRDGDLGLEAPGILPVVVTKDPAQEDVDRIRALTSPHVPVVLSSEAWDDYEVPGSPYVMVISAAPGSVATEGSVATWQDLVRLARSVG